MVPNDVLINTEQTAPQGETQALIFSAANFHSVKNVTVASFKKPVGGHLLKIWKRHA